MSLGDSAQAAYICFVADEVAKSRFKALSFRDGVLEIGVTNSIEAMQIQADQTEIVEEINKILKNQKVQRIRFRIY